MQLMITSSDYRHVSTGALARVARKVGKVFVAPATWYRLVSRHHWRRPRVRVYPPKPKVGIRARKPNEIWYVDTSLLRLLDGSRVYMRAVIDNFSRRIFAWTVRASFDTGMTAVLLRESGRGLSGTTPSAVMDSGVENIDASMNELIDSGIIKRILAQVDVTHSNSMILSMSRTTPSKDRRQTKCILDRRRRTRATRTPNGRSNLIVRTNHQIWLTSNQNRIINRDHRHKNASR